MVRSWMPMQGKSSAQNTSFIHIINDLADGQQLVCCMQTQAVQKYQLPANTLRDHHRQSI